MGSATPLCDSTSSLPTPFLDLRGQHCAPGLEQSPKERQTLQFMAAPYHMLPEVHPYGSPLLLHLLRSRLQGGNWQNRVALMWGEAVFFSDSGHSSPVEGTIYDYLSLCKAHWFMNIYEMRGLPYCCPSTRLWLHLVWEEEVNIKVCW